LVLFLSKKRFAARIPKLYSKALSGSAVVDIVKIVVDSVLFTNEERF